MELPGRDAERRRIEALLATARDGRGGALALHGAPGAGKTALLDAAAAGAPAAELRVLRATCTEAERQLPYAALHQLLAPAVGLVERLPAPQAQALRRAFGLAGGGAPERLLASLGALSLLAELAAEQPLLCLVDDVQWADDASADAILFAARRLTAEPIAALLAVRADDDAAAAAAASGVELLEVGALGAEAALALLAARTDGSVAPAVRDRLLAETGGNALALAELAAQLDRGQLAGLRRLPEPLPVGRRVSDAYAARLGALDTRARSLLLLAALHGEGDLATVLVAAGDGADAAGIAPAEDAGLIAVDGGRVVFRHPLVRAAVRDGASFAARRDAHRALAAALAGDPDRRAWHLAAAAVGPEPEPAAALTDVAARARGRGACAAASLALERAAELTADTAERALLLCDAARDAWQGGRTARATALAEQAAALDPPPATAHALARLRGTIETWGGRPARGCELLCAEAATVAGGDPPLALALLAEAAEAASFTGDAALAVRVGALAERVAPPRGDPRAALLHALLVGSHRLAAGELEQAGELLRTAVDGWEALDDPEQLNWAGRAAIYLGDARLSLALDRRGAELARERGALFTLPSILVRTAISQLWQGRLEAAEADGTEALALAQESGQTNLAACANAALAYGAALRGERDACRAHADDALAIARPHGLGLFADFATAALAIDALAHGRAAEALAAFEAAAHPAIALPTSIDRVEAALEAGRDEAAAAWAAGAQAWAGATGLPHAAAVAGHCAALCAPAAEQPALLEAVLARHAELDRPYEQARTQLALGRVLRRRRTRVAAREQLRAAAQGFEAIGALAWAERAREELRATGESVRRRDPAARDELTAQERLVASLVAEGLANKEIAARLFLSPRTIDFHLRNVFAKLGIASRTELAALRVEAQGSRGGAGAR